MQRGDKKKQGRLQTNESTATKRRFFRHIAVQNIQNKKCNIFWGNM